MMTLNFRTKNIQYFPEMHGIYLGFDCRGSRVARATCGRSRWRCGKCWCSAERHRSRSSAMNKWWRTPATGFRRTAREDAFLSGRRRVRGRSTIWWASVGSGKQQTARVFPRSISSFSARIWASFRALANRHLPTRLSPCSDACLPCPVGEC